MRLLLVEDEVRLSEALVYILKKNNYAVDAVYDGISGLEMAETEIYDVIILDRMLPGKEGVEILKELRKKNINTAVIMLTAKDAVKDRVEGLDAGADDYLIKPFSKEELLARIRALSRRNTEVLQTDVLTFGSLILNPLKSEICSNGDSVKLTQKESMILELLMRNKNQVITKDVILDRVWGLDSDIEINNLEVYLSYLRKKLSLINCGTIIETIRGVGYCLKEG